MLAVLFLAHTCGMGLFVAYVSLQTLRRSVGSRWFRLLGLAVAPIGVSAGLIPLFGGLWSIGATGYHLMAMWWLALMAFSSEHQRDQLVGPSLKTS